MRSKHILTIFLCVIILIISIIFICMKSIFITNGFHITVKNNTNITISGLKITYKNIAKDIDIASLEPNKKYSVNISPNEQFDENVMKIYYIDKQGNRQEEVIVGYFEKGDSGKVNIDINSVNSVGKLDLKINSR